MTCAIICCDLMTSNAVMARRSFHRIWIAGKKNVSETGPCSMFSTWIPRRWDSPDLLGSHLIFIIMALTTLWLIHPHCETTCKIDALIKKFHKSLWTLNTVNNFSVSVESVTQNVFIKAFIQSFTKSLVLFESRHDGQMQYYNYSICSWIIYIYIYIHIYVHIYINK